METTCPKHGTQKIIRHEVTRGSDPYDIEVCACGCHLVWFSKDDVTIVKEGN